MAVGRVWASDPEGQAAHLESPGHADLTPGQLSVLALCRSSMHSTRAGICWSVCSLQWTGVRAVTNGNTGIFEDCCLQLSPTPRLLYQKPSVSVIH